MQQAVVSLWSLLEACRSGSDAEQCQAASAAAEAVHAHCCRQPGLDAGMILERAGAMLMVDGLPAVGGVDTFAASNGLLQFMRSAEVARVQLGRAVAAPALRLWAGHVVAATTPPCWPAGIEVELQRDVLTADTMTLQPRAKPVLEHSDSRLRSVFLQHRLIAGLPAIAGVDPAVAKLVVQGVVDRLLQVSGGLEPLMLLQQDESLLRRSTAVAVLAVVFARSAGWPVEQLADLGAAALLHDVGVMLDPLAPACASFLWLLERGDEDFWLRSALIARRWRETALASADPAGPLCVVGVVRLAVAAHELGIAGVEAISEAGGAPKELARLAVAALVA